MYQISGKLPLSILMGGRKVIAEIWSGRTSAARRDAVTTELQARIQTKMKTASACRGAYVLQRPLEGDQYEILLLTLYEPERGSSREAPGHPDATPLCDFGDTLTRYEVITDPVRSLLYAELSRRFPPRMMAPR
jgi:hypothetical protein